MRKILSAAAEPSYWPYLLRGVLPTVEHRDVLSGIAPETIIDVGANKGQFSTFARREWPDAKIHAFEPIAEQAERLRQVLPKGVKLHQCALSNKSGEATLHLASRRDSSSLLPLGASQKKIFGMDEVGTIVVRTARLDEALTAKSIRSPALLKIDVQGFEFEVLEGITGLCSSIRWVFVEVSYVELYEGQRFFHDIEGLLNGMGFVQIATGSVTRDAESNVIQADVLFEYSPSSLSSKSSSTDENIPTSQ